MNAFAKFDEIPSMILQDIEETKVTDTFVRSVGRTDKVKTVYPPTNTVCGGINNLLKIVDGQKRDNGGITSEVS